MFLIICAVLFVLGIAFSLSGVGKSESECKLSDADRMLNEWEEDRWLEKMFKD